MTIHSLFAAAVLALLAPQAAPAEECGSCRADPDSPTGASMFCRFAGGTAGFIPCELDREPPDPAPQTGSGADLDLRPETTPVCSSASRTEWQRVVDDSLGVWALSFGDHFIREVPAEFREPVFGTTIPDNWRPLDVYKQTLCGRLQRFNVFSPGFGAEVDWNNFIIPAPPFLDLYTDALPFEGDSCLGLLEDDWPTCGATEECIEAEVTPDETFFENPWFPRSTRDSVLEDPDGQGPRLCTYGPWVRECVHGHKPEIHPSELYWWREPFGDADLYWLIQLQDDSERFDTESDFDCGPPVLGNCPAGWRPWASAPRRALFNVAFEVDPARERVELVIGEAFSQFVVTADDTMLRVNGVEDDPDRSVHQIHFDDQVVVTANELQPNDADVAMRFVGVCRDPSNRRLQGFLQIGVVTSEIPADGAVDHHAGYSALFVTRETLRRPPLVTEVSPTDFTIARMVPAPPPAPRAPRQTIVVEPRAETLRRELVGTRARLIGDLRLSIRGTRGAGGREPTVVDSALITGGERRSLPRVAGAANESLELTGIPVSREASLEIDLASGDRLQVAVPSVALAGTIAAEPISALYPSGAWSVVAAGVGGVNGVKASAPGSMRRVAGWRLRARPLYVGTKAGRPSPEDPSAWASELNRVLRNGPAKRRDRLFGSQHPRIQTAWRFEATDLTDGATIPVRTPDTVEGEGAVVLTRVDDSSVELTFPQDGARVIQLRAQAVLRDPLGHVGTVETTLWSDLLELDPEGDRTVKVIDPLLRVVARLAGTSPRQLLLASRIDGLPDAVDEPLLQDSRLRRARTVRLYAIGAAADGRISPGELTRLVRAARRFGGRLDLVAPPPREVQN